MFKRWTWLLAALMAMMAFGFAACGEDEEEGGTAGTPAAQGEGEPLKVGMVTDIGGLNDRGFNQLAYEGLKRAKAELGVEIRALTSQSNADYVPNLSTLARQDYDLVVAVGFLMGHDAETVANKFPDVNFATVDYAWELMKSKPKNVQGLIFKENEAGYIVGYAAGLYLKDKGGEQVASSVGGQKVPAVDAFIAGYEAGLKAANPEAKALTAYSQDFVDQAKCKEIALEQISQGSQAVFAVAGQCGLGALDAAKQEGVQGIGVDADQGYLGEHILTSAVKRVDEAVFAAIEDVQADRFEGGSSKLFSVEAGGIGFGELNAEGQKYADQLEEVQEKIASGEISDIPDEVK